MENAIDRTPVQLWIVGGLATLWNLIGPTDYLMTRMHNDAWIKLAMPNIDPQIVYGWVDSMPIWSQIGWALGVWGGLLGSILLLARSRHAVPAFLVSLLGVAMSLGWQLVAGPDMPAEMTKGGAANVMPYVIIVVAIALFLYARQMRIRGVLR